jgi:hypothetical protein
MGTRVILVMILFCFACQTGRIPCPKAKKVRLEKSARNRSAYVMTAQATADVPKAQARTSRAANIKEIQHVDIEEWDCPRPGTRKYMPKAVRDNIRKNMERVTADSSASTSRLRY